MNTEFVCTPGADAFEVRNEATSGNTHPAAWFLDWATAGNRSDSGINVNGYTALTHCPLWQGVNVIAGDVGQVPIRIVRDEFYDQRDHAAWKLLSLRPNSLQTPCIYTETIIQWALIWGNGVSWIVRKGSTPSDLIPLRPDCLWPELVAFDDGQVLIYHYTSPTTGKQFVFFPDDVCHIQGLTGDGVWGYPLHQIAKNTIGHGLALEKHGNKSFSNGARPSGVLKHPEKLSPEARANLRQEWNAIHEGAENSGKIAILQEAMEFQAMAMTNIDAQWLEAKKTSVYEAASLLNLPPNKLGAQDSSPRANFEEQNADYSQRTLSRWFTKLSQEYRRKLLTTKEWISGRYEVVFDVDQFLKGDIETMSTIAGSLVERGLLNPNEARGRYLRLPPYAGGEVYGSPHINPAKDKEVSPSTTKNDDSPADTPKTPATDGTSTAYAAHRDLLVDRAAHLIECETSRLRHAASTAPNFVAWLDEFYQGGGKSKLHSIYDAVMGKSVSAACSAGLPAHDMEATVAAWGLHRRNMILEACSLVSRDGLVEMVESFIVHKPQETAEQLLLTVLEGQ